MMQFWEWPASHPRTSVWLTPPDWAGGNQKPRGWAAPPLLLQSFWGWHVSPHIGCVQKKAKHGSWRDSLRNSAVRRCSKYTVSHDSWTDEPETIRNSIRSSYRPGSHFTLTACALQISGLQMETSFLNNSVMVLSSGAASVSEHSSTQKLFSAMLGNWVTLLSFLL